MDVIDLAQQQNAINEAVLIERARKPVVTTNPHKKCWHCLNPLPTTARFCDKHCAADWEASQ